MQASRHFNRQRRTSTFYKVQHSCGCWKSHLLLTGTDEAIQQAQQELQRLMTIPCNEHKEESYG